MTSEDFDNIMLGLMQEGLSLSAAYRVVSEKILKHQPLNTHNNGENLY